MNRIKILTMNKMENQFLILRPNKCCNLFINGVQRGHVCGNGGFEMPIIEPLINGFKNSVQSMVRLK